MKLTEKKVKYLIKDERMATNEYHKLGLHNIEHDERKHKNYLIKLLKQMEGK